MLEQDQFKPVIEARLIKEEAEKAAFLAEDKKAVAVEEGDAKDDAAVSK